MDSKNIALNLYSFGYYGGFIKHKNPNQESIGIDGLVKLVKKHQLGGVEIPIDRYYPFGEIKKGIKILEKILSEGLSVFIDIEKTDVRYITQLLPFLSALGIKVIRIKMDQIGETIYGGNRYKSDTFITSVAKFKQQLISLLPNLKKYHVALAIENHQDFHSSELVKLSEEISEEYIGVTWDIGNSVSVADSPVSFYKTAGHLVRNVHLKDYRIYRSEAGIKLVRCPVGEGYVDYHDVLTKLSSNDRVLNMSIELGAQITRECYINNEDYWKKFLGLPVNREEYLDFINRNISQDGDCESRYEAGIDEYGMIESEINDIEISISNLKQILKQISL